MKHKRNAKILLTLIALMFSLGGLFLLAGCGGVAPGSDPILVHAEQGQQAAHAAVKLFLSLEHDNRDFVKAELPEVHAAAESIRERYPKIIRGVMDAEDLYRETGDKADGDALDGQKKLLEGIAAEARDLLAKLKARKAKNDHRTSSPAGPAGGGTAVQRDVRQHCGGAVPQPADDRRRVGAVACGSRSGSRFTCVPA